MNVQCQLRQLQQQQWLILFKVFQFLEHFFWTLFCFHSCKVDPHWCGAQTSNPWESKTLSGSTPPSLRLANQHQPETYFNNWTYIQESRKWISIQYMYLFVKNSDRTWIGIFRCHHPVWNSSPLSPLQKNIIIVIALSFIYDYNCLRWEGWILVGLLECILYIVYCIITYFIIFIITCVFINYLKY